MNIDDLITKLGLAIAGEDRATVIEVLAIFSRCTCEQLNVNPDEFIALFKNSGSATRATVKA